MRETALTYLYREPAHYAGIISVLEKPEAQVLYANGEGVYVRFDWLAFVSARTEAAAEAILALIGEDCEAVLAHEPLFDEALLSRGYRRDLVCYPFVYAGKEPVACPLPAGVEIRRLTHEFDDFVLAHYSHAEGPEHIRERIDDGMFGLFENGEIAGFIGVHDTGEMGLLEVLPAFRRKGYASLLAAHIINERLRGGHLPQGEIETWNRPSLELQKKLGTTVSNRACTWFIR